MDNQQDKTEQNLKPTDTGRKKRKNRVGIADKLVSGGVIISFVGVLCFAALLIVMLVIKI